MGKRRDRRQQQASSRRVKLDLSADDVLPPSETPGSLEVLDSTLGEEVKSGVKNQEAANDNPLSLLGQYSDDEVDEENDLGAGCLQDIDNEARKDSLEYQDEKKDVAQSQGTGKISLEAVQSTGPCDIDSIEHDSGAFLISDTRVQDAAVENEWQPVLDEGSGEYYYWNVRTGKTTWVKPLEAENADKVSSQALDIDPSSGRNPKQSQDDEIHAQNDQRDSTAEDKSPACENNSFQYEENTITCLESVQNHLDNSNARLVSSKNNLSGAAAEKLEGIQDSESTDPSAGLFESEVDHESGELKEEEGKKDKEESLKVRKEDGEDLNFEVTNDIQRTSEKKLPQIETGMTSRNSLSNTFMEETDTGQACLGDASGCTRHSILTEESQKTVEEKMASLVEKGESLYHRLNVLARESSGGMSRHTFMASQTEARLTDWKAFCALGFVPDACLSFIQDELTQLESILTSEEANDLERRKLVESASPVEASHAIRPELKNSGWPLNWPYHQQDNGPMPEPWKQGHATEVPGNGDDVEEGEIQTAYVEIYPGYAALSDATTAVNATKVRNDIGTEDVDMDVDMEVDDEIESEPAVPGMSSDVPATDIPAPYSYPYTLPGSNDIAPLDPARVGEPTPYSHTGISGDSWAPPLPPDDEWAPPPPGESEPAPPPPPDEPPPLPPLSPEVGENYSMPSMPSVVQLQYYVPEYTIENNPLSQCVPAADYQSVIDSSLYGAYLEGGVYSNCSQPTETLEIEQPYVVASGSTQALNGWTVLAPTASLFVNPSSEVSVKSSSYALPVSTATSTTAESTMVGASLETKKQAKGKTKKRTHAVAAAPMLNKKVSSLVNKWKQAKEELHGGEDEDEDKALYDVEALEKKRQKEIEEWRRQQIASGEALDNANFQPLGTLDWRERVKRARKVDSKEGKEGGTGSVDPSSTVEGQNVESLKPQKPTIAELSKGLPPGWQAYWDEASGEVYYGNLSTQETTWDRPVT